MRDPKHTTWTRNGIAEKMEDRTAIDILSDLGFYVVVNDERGTVEVYDKSTREMVVGSRGEDINEVIESCLAVVQDGLECTLQTAREDPSTWTESEGEA